MSGDLPAGHVALDSTRGRLVVTTTVAGSAVAMLTATVVNVALPTIARDLGASSSQQQWVINGYLLPLAALILIGGSLGDRYGRLRLYRIGVLWFAAASLACAVAPTIETLIAARVLQGVGAAVLTPGSLAIIESTLRRPDRSRAVGQWSGLSGIAAAVGPLVGGLLVDLSWRWVFVVNIPIAAAVMFTSTRIPESIDPDAEDAPLDMPGAGLAAIGLGGASYALIQGPNGGWGVGEIAAGIVSVVALAALTRFETRRPHPMVPLDLFGNRRFVAANSITLLVYGGMGVVFFLLTIQLQVTTGWSALAAGSALLPVTALMLVLSPTAGALSDRIGPRLPLTMGPLLIGAGMLWLGSIGPNAGYLRDVLPGLVVFGLGLAATVAPVTATALGSVPGSRSGAASGTNNAVARTGQLLTVAAIPSLVGLGGDALNDPMLLDAGFPKAMAAGAVLVATGAVIAVVLMPRKKDESTDHRAGPRHHHLNCAVDGPSAAAPTEASGTGSGPDR